MGLLPSSALSERLRDLLVTQVPTGVKAALGEAMRFRFRRTTFLHHSPPPHCPPPPRPRVELQPRKLIYFHLGPKNRGGGKPEPKSVTPGQAGPRCPQSRRV